MSRIEKLLEILGGEAFDPKRAAGEPGPDTQDRHDKENQELAKLIVEQNKLLQEIYKHNVAALNAAKKYDAWLTSNKVETLMNKDAEETAWYINSACDDIKGIV